MFHLLLVRYSVHEHVLAQGFVYLGMKEQNADRQKIITSNIPVRHTENH